MSDDDLARILRSLGTDQYGEDNVGAATGSGASKRVAKAQVGTPVEPTIKRRREISAAAFILADELLGIAIDGGRTALAVSGAVDESKPSPIASEPIAELSTETFEMEGSLEENLTVLPSAPSVVQRVRVGGVSAEVGRELVLLGRAEDALNPFTDARVSRRHAMMKLVGGNYFVVDLNSKNGTRLRREGGDLVIAGEPVVLRVGDTLVTVDDLVLAEIVDGEEGGR